MMALVVDIMIALFDQEYAVKQYGNTMKKEGLIEGLASIVKKGRLTVEEAADESKMTVEDFKREAGLTVAQ